MITTRRSWSAKKSVFVVWGSVLSASVLVSLFTSARLPSVADAAIRQPLTLIVGALASALLLKLVLKIQPMDVWQGMIRVLPLALAVGVIASITGMWNDGSGVSALSFRSLLTFVVTGGILPTALGPEALLRFSLLGLSVLFAVTFVKTRGDVKRKIFIGSLSWIASAFVLLIPSWMALWVSSLRGLSFVHGQDAVRALGILHTSSYWSSFQADRFFAGVGNELTNASGLSTSAALLLVGLTVLAILGWRSGSTEGGSPLRRYMLRLGTAEPLFLLSGALGGFLIGIRGHRFSWSGVNTLAFLLLLVTVVTLTMIWMYGKELEHYDALLLITILAAAILGWPVLIIALAFLFIVWLLSLREFEWRKSVYGQAGILAILMLFIVALGGVVGARSPIYPHALSGWVAAWGLLVAGTTVLRQMSQEQQNDLKRVFALTAIAILGFIPLLPPLVLGSLFALLLLAMYHARSRGVNWNQDIVRAFLVFALVASVLSYFFL